MPVSLRLHSSTGVSGMKNMFDTKVKKHMDTQMNSAFSDYDGAKPQKISKDDANYGRPDPTSKSAARAMAAQLNIMMEIRLLCDMIYDCGDWKSADGRAAVTFGKLFNMYIRISDKLVGTLLRARKHGYVLFEGEMLFQHRDDAKVIELARGINTIRAKFGQRPLVCGGGEVEEWDKEPAEEHTPDFGGDITRRNSTPTKVKAPKSFTKLVDPKPITLSKLCNRSQSLDDLGSIMFHLESPSENVEITVTGADNNSAESKTSSEPCSEHEDLLIAGSDYGKKNNAPSKSAILPGRLTPRERSRSRAASPAPSMSTIEEDRETSIIKEINYNLDETISVINEIKDNLEGTTNAVNEIKDNLEGTTDAVNEIKDNLEGTTDAVNEIKDNLEGTTDAVNEIKDNLEGTTDAVNEIKDNLEGTTDVINETNDNFDETFSTIYETNDNSEGISCKVNDTTGAINETNDDLEETANVIHETDPPNDDVAQNSLDSTILLLNQATLQSTEPGGEGYCSDPGALYSCTTVDNNSR